MADAAAPDRQAHVIDACARCAAASLSAAHLEITAPGERGSERARLLLSCQALAQATATLVALESAKAAIACGLLSSLCEELARHSEGAVARHPELAHAVDAARACGKACQDFASAHRPRASDAGASTSG